MWRVYLLFVFCTLFFGCSNQGERKRETVSLSADKPVISINDKEQYANEFIRQYWDNFDYSDSTLIPMLETKKNIIISYVTELSNATLDSARLAIKWHLMDAEGSVPMHTYLAEAYKKFFYDPNSPIRDDELYIPVLEHLAASSITSEIEKTKAKTEMMQIKKNRVGESATNFLVINSAGKELELYDIDSKNTLLFFYNPGCHACEEIINELQSSVQLNKAVEGNEITVLAVYPDPDIDIWKNYQSNIPRTWINTYDKNQDIIKKRLYSIRAIPTLYLLDSDKKVILKDTDVKKIERYLSERSISN